MSEQRRSFRGMVLLVVVGAAVVGASHLFDGIAFERWHRAWVFDAEWGRLLRMVGYLPTWLIVAAAFLLIDVRTAKDRGARAVLLSLSAAASGLLAEGLKILTRRQRPEEHGEYIFRAFSEQPWSSSGLGLPSSHSAVAFGAAFILWRLHPQAWPVWLGLAVGCALTRVLDRAHFFSDVVAGAWVGVLMGALLWWLHQRNVAARAA
ncbi:MAG: phosphatase PAP2 family protein [Planctomycetota bacterium]